MSGAWLLVVRGSNHAHEVHALGDRVTTVGGPDDEIDLGVENRLALECHDGVWRASGEAWLLDDVPLLEVPRDEVTLRHGQTLSHSWDVRLRFLLGDRERVVAEERHLQTVIEPLSGLLLGRRALVAELVRLRPPAAVLMIDLDRLKNINNELGHLAGDSVLRRTAKLLHDEVRWPDMAARYGGEEFVVLLRDTSIEDARRRAERIRVAHEPIMEIEIRGAASSRSVEDVYVTATVSIGIAMLRDDPNAALREADENLELAKVQGRNRVVG